MANLKIVWGCFNGHGNMLVEKEPVSSKEEFFLRENKGSFCCPMCGELMCTTLVPEGSSELDGLEEVVG